MCVCERERERERVRETESAWMYVRERQLLGGVEGCLARQELVVSAEGGRASEGVGV